jgi:hypothetical protein
MKLILRVNSMGAGNLIKAMSLSKRIEAKSGWTVYSVDLISTRVGSSAAVKRTLWDPK